MAAIINVTSPDVPDAPIGVSALYAKASMLRQKKDYKGSAEVTLEAAALWLAIKARPSIYSCGFDAAKDYARMGDYEAARQTISTWMLPFQYCIKSDADVAADLTKVAETLMKQGVINEALSIYQMSLKYAGKSLPL
jgi:tetratricopeptide (TPR) repeat protein